MARRAKQKLLATIPTTFQPDFVERLDKRTRLATIIPARIAAICADQGGEGTLSYARRSLTRRAVWLEAIVETFEQRLAEDVTVDLGAYTQAINSLLGIYRQLGIERKATRVKSLQERLQETGGTSTP